MEDLVASRVQLEENGTDMQQRHWFEVDIRLDRNGKIGTLTNMMEAGQLGRFLEDVKQYNTSPTATPQYGTYAMADPDGYMPGMTTLAFVGLSVAGIKNVEKYQEPAGYTVSECAVNLLVTKR